MSHKTEIMQHYNKCIVVKQAKYCDDSTPYLSAGSSSHQLFFLTSILLTYLGKQDMA